MQQPKAPGKPLKWVFHHLGAAERGGGACSATIGNSVLQYLHAYGGVQSKDKDKDDRGNEKDAKSAGKSKSVLFALVGSAVVGNGGKSAHVDRMSLLPFGPLAPLTAAIMRLVLDGGASLVPLASPLSPAAVALLADLRASVAEALDGAFTHSSSAQTQSFRSRFDLLGAELFGQLGRYTRPPFLRAVGDAGPADEDYAAVAAADAAREKQRAGRAAAPARDRFVSVATSQPVTILRRQQQQVTIDYEGTCGASPTLPVLQLFTLFV